MPSKSQSPSVDGGIQQSTITTSASMDRPIINAEFLLLSGSHPVSVLIDSGVNVNIMDEDLALQLGLKLEPLPSPFRPRVLDGHIMGLLPTPNQLDSPRFTSTTQILTGQPDHSENGGQPDSRLASAYHSCCCSRPHQGSICLSQR